MYVADCLSLARVRLLAVEPTAETVKSRAIPVVVPALSLMVIVQPATSFVRTCVEPEVWPWHDAVDFAVGVPTTVNTKAQKLANMQPFGIPAAGDKIVLRRSSTAAMLNQGRHRERYTGAGLKSPLGRSKQVIFDGASISRSREK